MTETRPVLVVGAGPTGMTVAMELVRFGVPVRLIDRYAEPPTTSRALAVQARTMEMMQQRGLAAEMLSLGVKGHAVTIYSDGSQLGRVDLSRIESRFNFILLLAQSETERILRGSLEKAGVVVERQTELVAFSQGSEGVRATLRKADGSQEELEAAYLVDAEGAHSMVRHSMNLAFDGNLLPHSYVVADLHLEGPLPEDGLTIFVPESGLLAAFPLGNHRFRIIATEKQEVEKDAPAPDLAYVQGEWDQASHIPARFYDMVWSSRFRINSRALQRLRHGRIFFGGDSAHVHSPAGGQGMNTGIQDMMNLGWKLAAVYRGRAVDGLLDTYDAERMPIIHQLLATTERATDLMNSDSAAVHMLLRHAMPIALNIAAVQRKGATMVSELGGNYRKSPLNDALEGAGRIYSGDRFPDVLLEDGKEERALDVLDPSALTILCMGQADGAGLAGPGADFCTLRQVEKPSGELTAALGDAEFAVVRPDGYLLCAGRRERVETGLRAWMMRWMPGVPGALS